MNTPFSKFLYIGFLLLGLFQAFFSKDYMQAAASMGIGLAFDPFNPEQKWNDRPTLAKGSYDYSPGPGCSHVWLWHWFS